MSSARGASTASSPFRARPRVACVPHAHVGIASAERAARDLLAGAVFFEGRTDEERLSLRRNDAGKEPLAARPADVREIKQRRAWREDERVELFLGHQAARLLDAVAPLVAGDRPDLIAHRFQCGDRRRKRLLALIRLSERGGGGSESNGTNELATIHE